MAFDRKDYYYGKAKQEGYKSRAAYKLLEINRKRGFIKPNSKVLEVGAAPGGWSLAALELIGSKGLLVANDILNMDIFPHVGFHFVKGDILLEETQKQIFDISSQYDILISDVAPNTSGIKFADHENSVELVNVVIQIADKSLRKGGHLLFKLFDGDHKREILDRLKKEFQFVEIMKPESSRKSSFELYVLCRNKKLSNSIANKG